jgi:hypothetical protein
MPRLTHRPSIMRLQATTARPHIPSTAADECLTHSQTHAQATPQTRKRSTVKHHKRLRPPTHHLHANDSYHDRRPLPPEGARGRGDVGLDGGQRGSCRHARDLKAQSSQYEKQRTKDLATADRVLALERQLASVRRELSTCHGRSLLQCSCSPSSCRP